MTTRTAFVIKVSTVRKMIGADRGNQAVGGGGDTIVDECFGAVLY